MKLGRRRFLGWLGATAAGAAAAGSTAQALAKRVSPPTPEASSGISRIRFADGRYMDWDGKKLDWGPMQYPSDTRTVVPTRPAREHARVTLNRPLHSSERWQMRLYLDGLRRRPVA
jgi:hypothetical protein